MMFTQIRFSLGLMIVALGSIQHAHAQGVATGGSAVPARPLRAGMKPPTVEYHDIATQAGLTGVDISGSETSKQYIVEVPGNGVAIFDFDNDGLPDIFLVNSGTLGTGAVHPKRCTALGQLHKDLGLIYLHSGDTKDGLRELLEAKKLTPADPDIDKAFASRRLRRGEERLAYRNGEFSDE